MAAGALLRPPEKLTPAEWAERHIIITDGDRTGPIRFDDGYEFQRDILNELFRPFEAGEYRRVGVCFKGAQSGITTLCQIGILYWVCHLKTSAFHLLPREFDANDKAKKIAEMVSASAYLSEIIPRGLIRVRKTIGGQQLRVAYSNSQSELKNWQAGIGVFDEVDELESREYDSIAMAKQRMGSYTRRLEIYIGTPTLPDYGIAKVWQDSDNRRFESSCPLCHEFQEINWDGNIRWDHSLETKDDQAATARMICAHCDQRWDHRLRQMANRNGRWITHAPARKVKGFKLSRLIVPTALPEKMVSDYLAGLENETSMREHVNQNLGEAYLPTTGKLSDHIIEQAIDAAIPWGRIPRGTVSLTAGIDVQGAAEPYEFVWELRAYDADGFATVIAYGIARTLGDVESLFATGGQYRLNRGLIDISDGHHKDAVEELCDLIPVFQPAKFEWRAGARFDRGKFVKVKHGHGGFSMNRDDALQANLGRFFDVGERGRRIAIAVCPSRALERAYIDHYTHIARVKENTTKGPIYTYRKLRTKDVDFPFAGALAEEAKRYSGTAMPATGAGLRTGGKRAGPSHTPRANTGGNQRAAGLRIISKGRRRR